jgi:hypothetical protein
VKELQATVRERTAQFHQVSGELSVARTELLQVRAEYESMMVKYVI